MFKSRPPPAAPTEVVVPTPCLSIEALPVGFSSLPTTLLPTTLQASDSDGGPAKITFERIIVMPDGHKYIEGATPKQLPGPSHTLPNSDSSDEKLNDINESEASLSGSQRVVRCAGKGGVRGAGLDGKKRYLL
jgi:hypothetical protein